MPVMVEVDACCKREQHDIKQGWQKQILVARLANQIRNLDCNNLFTVTVTVCKGSVVLRHLPLYAYRCIFLLEIQKWVIYTVLCARFVEHYRKTYCLFIAVSSLD